jgi:GTP-binding protein EngB required for normal cell division
MTWPKKVALILPVGVFYDIHLYFQSRSRGLKNVVIIGHSGAGKSSLVNMLSPGASACVGNNAVPCTVKGQAYTCHLPSGQQYKVHDTIGLEDPTSTLFLAPKANNRLKDYLKPYMKEKELHLLIYCISGETADMKQWQHQGYKYFKEFVGTVPVVLVVTKLDDSSEGWWARNQNILRRLGMESEEHACVTTLPYPRWLYDESRRVVETLISRKIFGERDITVPPRDHVTMGHSQSNTNIPGKAALKQSGDQVRVRAYIAVVSII